MCRYAIKDYKPHYACFKCRKAYKRRLKDDVDKNGEQTQARCPQCGVLMADMGLDFRAPRNNNVKEWKIAESLWSVGLAFHSCGCGTGYRPRKKKDYKEFLQTILASDQRMLRYWRKDRPIDSEHAEKREATVAWFNKRIASLEHALSEA